MSLRRLVALPVYNEARHVDRVLDEVRRHSAAEGGAEILVVDDGSTDGTSELLAARGDVRTGSRSGQTSGPFDAESARILANSATSHPSRGDVRLVRHGENRGYGAALLTAFGYAQDHDFDLLVTIDCDGQHEPQRIPQFFAACQGEADGRPIDIVSGSRYLEQFEGDSAPPPERRRINEQVTAELNRRLCLNLTDAFCGFKCYRVSALKKLRIGEPGYAMPLEVWVQAAAAGLNIIELPVPLIYLDEKRSFGGVLDDGQTRLEYYHLTLDRAIAAVEPAGFCVGAACGEGRE